MAPPGSAMRNCDIRYGGCEPVLQQGGAADVYSRRVFAADHRERAEAPEVDREEDREGSVGAGEYVSRPTQFSDSG